LGAISLNPENRRCDWAANDPLIIDYHDREWGVPVHDDRLLFEFLLLEGAQAGLSWTTILRKRKNYRLAFDNFNPLTVSNYDENKVRDLLRNPGIVRNRRKIIAAITNAKIFLDVKREFGSFDIYIWKFVDQKPKINSWRKFSEIPTRTPESEKMSFELKKKGFGFVGPTICYAFMQAVGMVNDHTTDCFRYSKVKTGLPDIYLKTLTK
jgi:DNA-3-methyladenine glycosylase I